MKLYNVYQGNKKVLSNVTSDKVSELTGIIRNRIGMYLEAGKPYHGKTGEFFFDYPENELDKYPDPEFKKKWDEYRFRLNQKARRYL